MTVQVPDRSVGSAPLAGKMTFVPTALTLTPNPSPLRGRGERLPSDAASRETAKLTNAFPLARAPGEGARG